MPAPRAATSSRVANIVLKDLHATRVRFDLCAGLLGDERRRSATEIPVVVGEVMERRLGESPAHRPTVGPLLTVDDDGKIEVTAGCCASAFRQHSGAGHLRGHPALMWVRGKPLDPPARGQVGTEQFVHRSVGDHRLIVAVGTRVVVGPRDRRGVLVVAPCGRVDRLVVKLVDLPNRSEA